MTDIKDYIKGTSYEDFMNRAYRNRDNFKKGRSKSVITNLILVENGDTSFVKWHGSHKEQLKNLKIYMNTAIDKFMKMKKIPIENKRRIEEFRFYIDKEDTSDVLVGIINEIMKLTQDVKI